MATHNDAPFLCSAIDCILNQTFTDFEFIIVNDASTDETPAILDGYGGPCIVEQGNETNLRLTATFWLCSEEASSEGKR
jgi:glycosyltransferase involved in cell wall biosynthesis